MAKYGKVAHGDGYVLSLLVLARWCNVLEGQGNSLCCRAVFWKSVVQLRVVSVKQRIVV